MGGLNWWGFASKEQTEYIQETGRYLPWLRASMSQKSIGIVAREIYYWQSKQGNDEIRIRMWNGCIVAFGIGVFNNPLVIEHGHGLYFRQMLPWLVFCNPRYACKTASCRFKEYLTQKKMSTLVSCPKWVTRSISTFQWIPQFLRGSGIQDMRPRRPLIILVRILCIIATTTGLHVSSTSPNDTVLNTEQQISASGLESTLTSCHFQKAQKVSVTYRTHFLIYWCGEWSWLIDWLQLLKSLLLFHITNRLGLIPGQRWCSRSTLARVQHPGRIPWSPGLPSL